MKEITGKDRKNKKVVKVKNIPSFALAGVGAMVPSMVKATADITNTTNIMKKRGLLLALFMGEKSRKGSRSRKTKDRLKATNPQNLLGIDLNIS